MGGYPRPTKRLAALRALLARPSDTSANALLDNAALELGEHPEHLKQSLACRWAGIDTLAIKVQVNSGAVYLAEKADEILQRAAQPIH